MMVLWGRLYDIESRAKKEKYNSAQLLEARQKEAKPILEKRGCRWSFFDSLCFLLMI